MSPLINAPFPSLGGGGKFSSLYKTINSQDKISIGQLFLAADYYNKAVVNPVGYMKALSQ